MQDEKERVSVNIKIAEACRLLNHPLLSCGNDQIDQLEKDITRSTVLITEVLTDSDTRSLSREVLDSLNQYLVLSCKMVELIRARRSSIKNELLKLNNGVKLSNKYETRL